MIAAGKYVFLICPVDVSSMSTSLRCRRGNFFSLTSGARTMPMKVKVGLAKKLGQPDFGSLGASCDIELELDGGLLFQDLQGLQEKIQSAYVACRQAVNDELAIQHSAPKGVILAESLANDRRHDTGLTGDSQLRARNNTRETDSKQFVNNSGRQRRAATTSQIRALHAIATRQGFNLTELLKDQFQLYRAEDLSLSQASRLIDDLNGNASSQTNRFGGKA